MFEGFERGRTAVEGAEIAWVAAGQGAPVLLLHGFPQCMALWAQVAPALVAAGYRVIAADLRGYGASSKPPASPDFASHSFRAMAGDMCQLMTALGHPRFHLVGHDRGGRTAHRLALDAPDRLGSVTIMDIVPTHALLTNWRWPVARAYWHWSFLAQPAPFPESVIAADPDRFYQTCLAGWGAAGLADFPPEQLAAYRAAWRDPEVIAGMCNDYRAAPAADLADDSADATVRLAMPALIMWGEAGVMARLYDMAAIWADRCTRIETAAMPGGHFFVDSAPQAVAGRLIDFLSRQSLQAGFSP